MIRSIILSTLLLFSFLSCENEMDPCNNDFDQESLFVNVADNLILPAYANLDAQVDLLETQTKSFNSDVNIANLTQLKTAFQNAYLAFQTADLYEFGPAEDALFRTTLNNFPVNIGVITQNLENGNWDLDTPDGFDRGFPALDYLLYGVAENEELVVEYYQTNALALDYLMDVVVQIKTKTEQVNELWKASYRDQFVQNGGTAAGSSLSQIINGLNLHYENIKRDKIGIPSGVLTLGFTNPDKVEAFHSGLSLQLAKRALEANYNLFTGLDGIGLDDYLIETDANENGESLANLIKKQYLAAREALNEVNESLSEAVENQSDEVIVSYNELTKQVVQLKTDMPSILCVSITYVDNPSDSD